jgi:uncharacterized protein YjiS (DUF1127 family)
MEAAMPNAIKTQIWQFEFRAITPDEHHRIVRQARAEQARIMRSLIRLMARRVRRAAAGCRLAVDNLAKEIAAAGARRFRSCADWKRHRRAMAVLNGLSDASLKDIGVTRSEIPWVAKHGRSDRLAHGFAKPRPQLVTASKPAQLEAAPAPVTISPSRKHAA